MTALKAGIRGTGFTAGSTHHHQSQMGDYTPKFQKPALKRKRPKKIRIRVKTIVEPILDVYQEAIDKIIVIGEFPSITMRDILTKIDENILSIINHPDSEKHYKTITKLPIGFNRIIKKEIQNGFLILTVKKQEV